MRQTVYYGYQKFWYQVSLKTKSDDGNDIRLFANQTTPEYCSSFWIQNFKKEDFKNLRKK